MCRGSCVRRCRQNHAFLSLSTIEHCDIAYLEAQWKMHGPIYTMISAADMMQPYTGVLNRIRHSFRPEEKLFPSCQSGRTGHVCSPFHFFEPGCAKSRGAFDVQRVGSWGESLGMLWCILRTQVIFLPPADHPPSLDDIGQHLVRRCQEQDKPLYNEAIPWGGVRCTRRPLTSYIYYDDGDVEEKVNPCLLEGSGMGDGAGHGG